MSCITEPQLAMSFLASLSSEDRRIQAKYGPAPTGKEREAMEAQYRSDYGNEYIEDRPATKAEIAAVRERYAAKEHADNEELHRKYADNRIKIQNQIASARAGI